MAGDFTLHLRKHDPKTSLCLHAMAVFAVHGVQAQNKYTKKNQKKIKYPHEIKSYSIPHIEYAPHATNATLEFNSYPLDLPYFPPADKY